MAGYRLPAPAGRAINRERALNFRFNGDAFSGLEGDTLASALIAAGVRLVGRSFKYHRPRGIVAYGVEEPIGLLDVGEGAERSPNTRSTDTALTDGLVAETGNVWPSVGKDVAAMNSLFADYFSAGFYYKTFMWPDWHLYEPTIRRMAGLGRAGEGADPARYDEQSLQVEVLVAGGGLAGLQAAVAAAESGREVLLLEGEAWLGGWAATLSAGRGAQAESMRAEIDTLVERAKSAGVRTRLRCTAFGMYDHGLVTAIEPGFGLVRERTLKIRAGRTVLATGGFDRPMLFPDNDRPGVMFAHGAEAYAAHYGVAVGQRIVLAHACDAGAALAERLRSHGLNVVEVLNRRRGDCIVGVRGSQAVEGIEVAREDGSGRRRIEADTLLHVGGLTPNVSLHSQAGGGLRWDEGSSMFVPTRLGKGVSIVGAAAGAFDLSAALEHAERVGRGTAATDVSDAPVQGAGSVPADNAPSPQALSALGKTKPGKTFVDLQNDVTQADVAQAALENYRSVEHLKRYTTTGMATDQGKTSNVNALVQMGQHTGRTPGQVGTTKFRPPYKTVTLGAIVAGRTGERHRPLKRMPAHAFHAERGALFEEFGGWWRPAAYPKQGESIEHAAEREAAHTRRSVCLFEQSPLGKIEVVGPDAAAFLDLMYVGTMSTLTVGSARYGLLLNENGIVVDDGIVARLDPEHFWVNTTSGGAERTALAFEEWLQCEYVNHRVFVQPVVSQWGNVTLAGPKAWGLLEAAGFDASLAPAAMKHMTMREVAYAGTTLRVMRASFSGELGYEINLPALYTQSLIERLWSVGQRFDVGLYGIEALMVMRLEKGFIHVGADTDGTTLPQDIGMARGVDKKAANFVGRRSLSRPAGKDANRLQLVGLQPVDRRTKLPVGAHIAPAAAPSAVEGFVTSSGYSPALQQPIALALLARGSQRIGDKLRVWHLGQEIAAEVVKTPFFDAVGERLHG